MNSELARIRDAKVTQDGEQQYLIVEFNDGKVRQFTPKELYEATGYLGQPPSTEQTSGAQRRAAEILNMRRGR